MAKKKRGKTAGGEELVAGLPLKSVQEFLCRHEDSEWFNFDWLDGWRFARGEDKAERSRALERLTREMLARRWIEKVPSKSTAKRYKLTVSGRHYAAECRHLFKWPAAQSRIRPAPRHPFYGREWLECLKHLHLELSRVAMGDREDLASYQDELLRDLETGLDEEALSFMYDYWNYDTDRIAQRSQLLLSGYRLIPSKPRIDLKVSLSKKGNLIVEWFPTGMNTPDCDWVRWEALQHRAIAFTSRPSNELLFVHNVEAASRLFPGLYTADEWSPSPETVMIDSILLEATAALLTELKERLDRNFAVHMITDIFTEWEKVESKDWPNGKADVLTSWKIENVEARNKKASLEEIDRFPEQYGCPVDAFVKALIDADAKKAATGPAPAPHTKHDRVSRQLKKAGYSKISVGVVERFHALLQKHRPELFPPAPAAPTVQTPTSVPGDKVVPFRKPNDPGTPDAPSRASCQKPSFFVACRSAVPFNPLHENRPSKRCESSLLIWSKSFWR